MQHIAITKQVPSRKERPERRFSLIGSNIALSSMKFDGFYHDVLDLSNPT